MNMENNVNNEEIIRNPEFSSELVRISDKIKSTTSKPQLIKIGGRYFRVRELG